MLAAPQLDNPFLLSPAVRKPLPRRLLAAMEPSLDPVLGTWRLGGLYRQMMRLPSSDPFPERVLDTLQIGYRVAAAELARIPAQGPLVIVANHPFGAIEGVVLASLLRRVRPDVKILANYLLSRLPEMQDLIIPVDPFGGRGTAHRNLAGLRQALAWVKGGGALAIFPAGEVSHLAWGQRQVTDPPWAESMGRLIARTGAPVVPVFFSGRNGAGFQLAGLLHPRLRTLLLGRQLLASRGKCLQVRAGAPIAPAAYAQDGDPGRLVRYLRFRTYLLGVPRGRGRQTARGVAIAPALAAAELAAEVARLGPAQELLRSGEFGVYCAQAAEIPRLLTELGRLRELTFRQAGEGTGKALDLDAFDHHYRHLFIWNHERRELVGAYRLGRTDEILPRYGIAGLYTATSFRYEPEFFARLGPAVELGRSFIRAEYQRQYASLLLLWKGVATYLARHPQLRRLFGAVSVSNDYTPASRAWLERWLRRHAWDPALAAGVRGRRPSPPLTLGEADPGEFLAHSSDLEELSAWIAAVEPDGQGVPVLIKQYLKLGGRMLAFDVDPAFGYTLDGLVCVDFHQVDERSLRRFLGNAGAEAYLAQLGRGSPDLQAAGLSPAAPVPEAGARPPRRNGRA